MPYKDPEVLRNVLFVLLGFIGALISILYGLLGGKKVTIMTSIAMIAIGGFVGWVLGASIDSNLAAAVGGAMSLEIMHTLKENGPEIFKQKLKDIFRTK